MSKAQSHRSNAPSREAHVRDRAVRGEELTDLLRLGAVGESGHEELH
jgi:hypothetical protein